MGANTVVSRIQGKERPEFGPYQELGYPRGSRWRGEGKGKKREKWGESGGRRG